MGDFWVFGDESGNFDFSAKGSRYFIVGTLSTQDQDAQQLRSDLTALRVALAHRGIDHDGVFHASEDRQAIRDMVFPLVTKTPSRGDVTLVEKAKAYPHLHTTDELFYQYAWYYHLRYTLRYAGQPGDTVHVVLADYGTKAKRAAFRNAVERVLNQLHRPSVRHELAFWKPGADGGLQAVDYLIWAVARYRERGDDRSYRLVRTLLNTEYFLFG